ncbi:MAG: GTPase Era, partial [Flavobacteriales bacterium]|nr:GTPase Era [Flavobacteriales bacterium]
LSIITSKAQTTRHRIMGIVNGEHFQIVYSDTPGMLDPKYKLHEGMMKFVGSAFADADILIFVTEPSETVESQARAIEKINTLEVPVIVLLNKIDLAPQEEIEEKLLYWQQHIPRAKVAPISALHKFNVAELLDYIIQVLPVSPPFFPKDELTDKPMRFFVSEIIREKILVRYKQEIPYSCEVLVTEYKEEPNIVRIRTEIMVNRESQKSIMIGHQGKALKSVGTEARKDLESFIGKKVFLEIYVKVDKNWRNDPGKLKKYGYFSD